MPLSESLEWLTAEVLEAVGVGVRSVPGCDRDDAVQEALARFLARPDDLARFETVAEVVAYLRIVARNFVIDHVRRSTAYQEMAPWKKDALRPRAEAYAEEGIYAAEFLAALDELPARERRAFGLYRQGHSNEWIARDLDVGKNEPKKLIGRALRHLRKWFETEPACRRTLDGSRRSTAGRGASARRTTSTARSSSRGSSSPLSSRCVELVPCVVEYP